MNLWPSSLFRGRAVGDDPVGCPLAGQRGATSAPPTFRPERHAWLMLPGLAIVLAAALFAAGCAAPATTAATVPPLVLLPKDSDGIVNVTLGRRVEIRLPANPSTGYRWDIDRIDAGVLVLDGAPEFVPDANLPGGAGTTVFRFRAARVGNGMLRLAHRLPWEQANKGETFTAMVRVREG